jgi:hypothetical protein
VDGKFPTGPYHTGTVKYIFVNIYRNDIQFPNGKLIPIQIYFPLEQGGKKKASLVYLNP